MATVDYEAVAAGLSQAIPFNVHLGLQTIEVGPDSGVVLLPDAGHLHNHVGTQHAGALFAAGEAASGAAFVGAFMAIMGEITPLAESAEISYRALAKGEITATARFSEDRTTRLRASPPPDPRSSSRPAVRSLPLRGTSRNRPNRRPQRQRSPADTACRPRRRSTRGRTS